MDTIRFGSNSSIECPDFLEVQLDSFFKFFKLGSTYEERKKESLYKVFQEHFPLSDSRNQFVLEFLDYNVDPPRYSIQECILRGLNSLLIFMMSCMLILIEKRSCQLQLF